MRYIKMFFFVLIGLFIIITLLSLLLPSESQVSRAVVISNATTGKIYTQIADFRNWKNWEPLFASDSAVITFSSTNTLPFCDVAYKGRQVHLGMTSIDSTAVKFMMQAKGKDDIVNEIDIIPVGTNNGIQVEWKALTKLHWYPWDKLYGIFVDRMTGNNYEDALNHLKDFIESK
jgi:hypothetical protein